MVIRLAPQFAKLVELLDLGVLHLDEAILAMTHFLTLLTDLFRAITAATSCAVVAMVATHEQPIELTIAQLAIGLVLLRSARQIVAKLDSGDHGWVQGVNLDFLLVLLMLALTTPRILDLLLTCRQTTAVVVVVLLLAPHGDEPVSRLVKKRPYLLATHHTLLLRLKHHRRRRRRRLLLIQMLALLLL